MKIIVKDSVSDASAAVADMLLQQIGRRPDSVLGLPTGGTPLGVYARLREAYRNGQGSYKFLTTFNVDEYIGLSSNDPESYAAYMLENLFGHVNIDIGRTHLPRGSTPDADVEAARYEGLIAAYGGIDLILLGLGRNAHIGFNEPGSPHNSRTRCVALTKSTMDANAAYFPAGAVQPSHAITMGIGTILDCRKIVVLATGADKAEAVAASVEGPPSDDVPGSALIRHADTTIVLDRAAAANLDHAQTRELEA